MLFVIIIVATIINRANFKRQIYNGVDCAVVIATTHEKPCSKKTDIFYSLDLTVVKLLN